MRRLVLSKLIKHRPWSHDLSSMVRTLTAVGAFFDAGLVEAAAVGVLIPEGGAPKDASLLVVMMRVAISELNSVSPRLRDLPNYFTPRLRSLPSSAARSLAIALERAISV